MYFKKLPTQEELAAIYNYNPLTGELTYKVRRGKQQPGNTVGSYCKKDNRYIVNYRRERYYVSRIIWLLHYGEDPGSLVIDHKNRNPCDNRIVNLRAITQAENVKNNPRCDEAKLCSFMKGAFQAQYSVNGKIHYAGRFPTEAEATAAALKHKAALPS